MITQRMLSPKSRTNQAEYYLSDIRSNKKTKQTQTQQEISSQLLNPPTETQMNQYLKKIFLQTYHSNQHVDRIRMNYLKLKNKKNQQHHHQSTQLNTHQSISSQSAKNISINDYLKKLSQQSQQSTLPEQIRNNKQLCSLYHKLDLFENNLIAEHQKQQSINRSNQKLHQDQTMQQQTSNDPRQIQWNKKTQITLKQMRKALQKKQQKLNQLKNQLNQQDNLRQLNIPQFPITSLMTQTQKNLNSIRQRLQNMEQTFIKIKNQQRQNDSLSAQISQLEQQIKNATCELFRRKNLF